MNTVRTFPAATLAVTGMIVMGAFLLGRAVTQPSRASALAVPSSLRRLARPDKLRKASQSWVQRIARPDKLRTASQSWARRLRHAVAA